MFSHIKSECSSNTASTTASDKVTHIKCPKSKDFAQPFFPPFVSQTPQFTLHMVPPRHIKNDINTLSGQEPADKESIEHKDWELG